MIEAIWQDILTSQDQYIIDLAGYRTRGASTFSSRGTMTAPALLIIDMQRLFIGDDVPIEVAVKNAPTMIGERGWRAIENILPLVATCRARKIPVIYAKMMPHNRPHDDPMLQIVDPLKPNDSDIVLTKTTSSVFFNGEITQRLKEQGVDSVILVGNSTSGCIRVAAVDAVQHGFTAIVPHDCVFDRIETSHKISLLDMWMKYAVVTSSEILLSSLSENQPQLGVQ